jgi:type II secretory pathway pseudopilin PulG
MTRRTPSNRRAFTLLELLGMLALLGVFMLISGQLFLMTTKLDRSSREQADQIARADNLLRLLRRDVWSATAMQTGESGLQLTTSPGQTIEWNFDSQGTLTRTAGSQSINWKAMPSFRFDVHGPLVTVVVAAGKTEESLTLPSQPLLLAGGAK